MSELNLPWRAYLGPNAPAWEIYDSNDRLVAKMACLEAGREAEAEYRAKLVASAPTVANKPLA